MGRLRQVVCPGCGQPTSEAEGDYHRDGLGREWHMECWLRAVGGPDER